MADAAKKRLVDAEKKVNRLMTKPGAMTEGAKQGFEIMLNELSKFNAEVNNLANQVQNQNTRLDTIEKTNTQMLEMINNINNKVNSNDKEKKDAEKKAAWVDAVQVLLAHRFVRIMLFLILCTFGLAVAYIIEHSIGVSQIVGSIK